MYCNSQSPEKIWEEAKLMRTENNMKESIINLESIIKNYPDHILASRAQYKKAEIYLNDIKDFDFAIEEFEKVIRQYPNHEVAKNSLFMIAYIYNNYLSSYTDAIDTYSLFINKYPNDVKVVIKNFPLSFHKQAMQAAKYGLAAHKQGKFKEMYHKIFDNYKDLKINEKVPEDYARDLGLNMNQFIQDAGSEEISNQINLEINQLRNSGIPRLAVPKFLIQGKEPQGRDLATFSAMIDAELKK